MASGYFITGITTANLFKLIRRNRLSFHPKYLFRFFIILIYSFGTTLFTFFEKLLYSRKIDRTACPLDPIFIVGHWRSGTTFLHQIFNAMPGFKTPSVLEIGTPECFLVSNKILAPIIQKLLPAKRSTDNVSLSIDEPQEDEYALFRATTHSPVEKLIFPEKDSFFLDDDCDFLPPPASEKKWKDTLQTFCKKLSLTGNGKIVLKNPFHSTRILYLKKMFPKAKFIHIYRDPVRVIPSTMRMWKIEGQQNSLCDGYTPPDLERAIGIYDTILKKIKKDLRHLRNEDHCTIHFRDLEAKPAETVTTALSAIGITLTAEQRQHLTNFVNSLKHYRKNRYILPKEKETLIRRRLKHHIDTAPCLKTNISAA